MKGQFDISKLPRMFLILGVMILLIGTVDAATWDNIYRYDESTQSAVVENALGLGEDIARFDLIWGNSQVGVGDGTHVGTFGAIFYSNATDEAFEGFILKDLKNGGLFNNKGVQYKVKVVKTEDRYISVCDYYINGTYGDNCRLEEDGKVQINEWIPIGNPNFQFQENVYYEIGVFVDTENREKGDWIPQIMGVEIEEWAFWDTTWGANILLAYEFNESSGNILDTTGNYSNPTKNSVTQGVTGKINNSINLTGSTSYLSDTWFDPDSYNTGLSFNVWVNMYKHNSVNNDNIFRFDETSSWGGVILTVELDGDITYRFGCGADTCQYNSIAGTNAITLGNWHMITITHNTTTDRLYIDGALVHSTASGTLANSATTVQVGKFGGHANTLYASLDEFYWWGRDLSQDDINNLYDGGAGTSISLFNSPPSITSYVDNASYVSVGDYSFIYDVQDVDDDLANVSIYVDGVLNQTNSSGILGNYTFTVPLGEGDTEVMISAVDGGIQQTNSSTNKISIDATLPTILIEEPTGTVTNNGSIELNTTIADDNLDSCWYDYNYTNTTFTCGDIVYFTPDNYRNITVWANDTAGNEFYNTSVFNWYINIHIQDEDGVLLSSTNAYIEELGLNITENTISRTSTYFLGDNATRDLYFEFSDQLGYKKDNNTWINFTVSQGRYNVTMASKYMLLTFINHTGQDVNVTGYYLNDTLNRTDFYNESIVEVIENLYTGLIYVRFGYNSSPENYTQYYEFDNDWINEEVKELTILEEADDSKCFRVVDESNNPIPNALIKASMEFGNNTLFREIGQRFTDEQGYACFFFDKNRHVILTLVKDDYEGKTIPAFDVSEHDESTLATARVLILRKSNYNAYSGSSFKGPNYFNSTQNNITVVLFSIGKSSASIVTSYGEDNGASNKTCQLGYYDNCIMYLYKDVDWNSSSTDDITVKVYFDDIFWQNIQINNGDEFITDKFNAPNNMNENVKRGLAFLGLIVLTGFLGLMFGSGVEGEGEGSFGKNIFLIGCALLILIDTQFKFLTAIAIVHFSGLIVSKWISE